MKKTIVIACATGVATSTVIANRVEDLCKKNNIEYQLIQCKVPEVGSYEDRADLIITSGKSPRKFKAVTIKATSYITGINDEQTDKDIINALQNN
ncbi:PTS sugar transporter subunit IIB [Tetragenococcus halophilus]|uniref:PTS galactitol transporter subunit IIB n=1 Tax=Tetragenococcus halophilus TaxID=51669 RepID=A0AB37D3W3_TETHA|nr:PTS sugar transporter subunit IIB [Tetragenococcus halophilus]MDN6184464.1 PTS sugar transporter subunit IIB [Lactococcus lactis]MDN6270895.1 PTS sugar transporter subunit IIB [Tetragenococcus koreensis]MDN6641278.1 PTS sugar transporter subunit IIB [Tetragenococcus sp.]MDN6842106.1 PTS sugar transporter subunit IIB [Staphylococcus equorum]MCF1602689.1 PTS sugar transporter subunit IIB [Tetragenococcus halophilus]